MIFERIEIAWIKNDIWIVKNDISNIIWIVREQTKGTQKEKKKKIKQENKL